MKQLNVNKKLIVILFGIILISLVSAETFPQSGEVDFIKSCTNSSDNICSPATECRLNVRFPLNNTYMIYDGNMTNNETGMFNYTFAEGQLTELGKYSWDMFCCDGDYCGEAHDEFQVTKTGGELSQDRALIYIGMLALLVFIFVIIIGGIAMLPSKNISDDDNFIIGINNLKYLRSVLFILAWALLIAIIFTSSNISYLYLEAKMMGDLFFSFYKVMMWLTLPMVLIWFLFIFVNIFQDRELKSLLERGVPIQTP